MPAFASGEPCVLLDSRGRRYLVDLAEGRQFQYHAGVVEHDAIVGAPVGTVLRSSTGARLVALRPRLADFILLMKRRAQLIYPKDIGPILHWGDIGPGMTVLEAGTGSGALTLALVRAVGAEGRVVSVEARDDHADHAVGTMERFLGKLPPSLELRRGDVVEVAGDVMPDRIVLDLPEPWSVIEGLRPSIPPGAVVTVYLPTVPQVQRLADALRRSAFVGIETFEILFREWKVEGRSVRPESMMVGHTGFITIAHASTGDPDGSDA